MSSSNYQVRRATVDDLPVLRRFWQQGQLPASALEKRLTEFQVVETPGGDLLGAIGLAIQQQQGHLHSEAYKDSELAINLRPRLWDRLQSVARNHGLYRLWVENKSSLFWLEQGFEAAGSDVLEKLPGSFATAEATHWLSLKLRDEPAAALSVDQELEVFRQSQIEQSQRVIRQARTLRAVAAFIVMAVLVAMSCAGWYVLQHFKKGPGL